MEMDVTDKPPPPAFIFCVVEMEELPSPLHLASVSAGPSPVVPRTLAEAYPHGMPGPVVDVIDLRARLRALHKRVSSTCPIKRALFKMANAAKAFHAAATLPAAHRNRTPHPVYTPPK